MSYWFWWLDSFFFIFNFQAEGRQRKIMKTNQELPVSVFVLLSSEQKIRKRCMHVRCMRMYVSCTRY